MTMMHNAAAEDATRVLTLARRAVDAQVRGLAPPGGEHGGILDVMCGVFVSIYCEGELRGCLGRVQPSVPLGETIVDLAAAVADSDPRFDPIRAHELEAVSIEVSVLTEPVALTDVARLDPGRHGLIVEQGSARGLLLPQVAAEHGWDAGTFLEQVCVKARLPRDAWRHGARLYVFEAEVFKER